MGLNFAEVVEADAVEKAAAETEKNDAAVDRATPAEVLPPAGPVFSLEKVKPRFRDVEALIAEHADISRSLTVTNEESLKLAVAIVGATKKAIRSLDEQKKGLAEYKEAKGFVDRVNNFVGDLKDRLTMIVNNLDPRVTQYNAQIELERRQREEAQRRAAEELQRKIDAEVAEANRKAAEEAARKAEEEAKARKASEAEIEAARKKAEEEAAKNAIEAPKVQEPIAPKQETTIRTETGTSAHSRKPWKHRIIDGKKVPREYCSPSDALIREAIKQGVREIPGVEIFQETKNVYR